MSSTSSSSASASTSSSTASSPPPLTVSQLYQNTLSNLQQQVNTYKEKCRHLEEEVETLKAQATKAALASGSARTSSSAVVDLQNESSHDCTWKQRFTNLQTRYTTAVQQVC
jgi:hypothetical protein